MYNFSILPSVLFDQTPNYQAAGISPPSARTGFYGLYFMGPLGLRSSSARRVRSKVGPGFEFLCDAQIHSIVERVSRLRGCASTQALQPGGVTAKVMGGCQGTNRRGHVLGCQFLCEAKIQCIVERVARMGKGRS